MVCEVGEVEGRELERLLPGSQCQMLQGGAQTSVAERYVEYAGRCLEGLQSIVRGRVQSRVQSKVQGRVRGQGAGKVLVQLVVGEGAERALVAGLRGMVQTAAQEHPEVVGQVMVVGAGTRTGELAEWLRAEKNAGVEGVRRDGLI